MNQDIIDSLRKILARHGREVLGSRQKLEGLLEDYLQNRYPGEQRVMLTLLEAGQVRQLGSGEVLDESRMRDLAFVLGQQFYILQEASYLGIRAWQAAFSPDAPLPPERLLSGADYGFSGNAGRGASSPFQGCDAGSFGVFRCRACGQHQLCLTPQEQATQLCIACSRKEEEELAAKKKAEEEAAAKKKAEEELAGGKRLCKSLPGTYTNSIGMEFVLVPPGVFLMGSPGSDEDVGGAEQPQHLVTISQPLYLGRYPVTQAQWQAVMGKNPSAFQGENRPVERVTWEDAQAFIRKLNAQEGHVRYRLPTEAEWEYACRAGSRKRYRFGDDAGLWGRLLERYAWYEENSGWETHPVGQKQANAWGLYDMHGNVWEWVQDWYGEYPAVAVLDPEGPSSGTYRVLRGGGWLSNARNCRAAFRVNGSPDYRYREVGFRLALGSAGRQ